MTKLKAPPCLQRAVDLELLQDEELGVLAPLTCSDLHDDRHGSPPTGGYPAGVTVGKRLGKTRGLSAAHTPLEPDPSQPPRKALRHPTIFVGEQADLEVAAPAGVEAELDCRLPV